MQKWFTLLTSLFHNASPIFLCFILVYLLYHNILNKDIVMKSLALDKSKINK